eukprot:m.349048 g.349048  ORF g.349048 m.349048 type:complete len:4259 (-) comp19881_c0_seq4:199-12975(-)
MATADARKDYVVSAVAAHTGLALNDPALASFRNAAEVDAFLDSGSVLLLVAAHDPQRGVIACAHSPDKSLLSRNPLVFYKLQPRVVDQENLQQNVLTSSIGASPINTLYHQVKKLYAPILLQGDDWGDAFGSKLQSLLGDLESNLGTALRHDKVSPGGSAERLDEIQNPQDEHQYWSDLSSSGGRLMDRERAQYFRDLMQPVSADFVNIDSMSVHDLLELVEKCQDLCDDLWKQTQFDDFPADRMKNLFEVIGRSLKRAVQDKLAIHNMWSSTFNQVRDDLQAGLQVCTKWCKVTEELTGQFWKTYTRHPWSLGKFSDASVADLGGRLAELLTLRTVHEQLVRLLSPDEQRELGTADMFSSFEGLQPLRYNPYTQPLWEMAVAEYERKMQPAERKIAEKLRTHLSTLKAQSHQLLREFERYRDLIRRPNISRDLISERETLLAQLSVYIKGAKEDFQKRTVGQIGATAEDSLPPAGRNVPETVNSIVWSRQLLSKVEDTLNTAESLLSDLSGTDAFRTDAVDFLEELQAFQKEQFQDWCLNVQDGLEEGGDLQLETTGRLMTFDHKDGKLQVHYSDRLVALLREVRALSSLGFVVPAKIQHVATTARKFYRHGVVLKQVAHFYNSIDEQIIDSQYVMLEKHARHLESVIKNPKGGKVSGQGDKGAITWDNPKDVEEYVTQLQAAAERLTTENRKLRKYHGVFAERVVTLMDTDLLRNQDKWKEGLHELRAHIAHLEAQGFTSESMKPWKVHWDHQLYKALEHQYQMGLEGLNELLPEIKVDLVFRQQKLQFRPPLEEIRAKYYRELKKFLIIPERFGGLADPALFKVMVDRNASGFSVVYRKAEALFSRLSKVVHHFRDWVVLGAVQVDALVESTLEDVSDWEDNFRSVKAKGREAEKLPSTIKVDCITVSTAPVKASIDDQIQQLFDSLIISLRKAVHKHVTEIEGFVERGMEALSARPQTVEEIGEVNAQHAELSREKPGIKPHFENAETKNRLLRAVAGVGVDLASTQARWDKFELMLDSHALMIKEQVEVMKAGVESRVEAFNAALEKFTARWEALKPKNVAMDDKDAALSAIKTIKERRAEFDALMETADGIKRDCSHFGVAEPPFGSAEAVRDDLEQMQSVWSLFEEFVDGLQELTQEDWITFRGKLYRFKDFLESWVARLKGLSNIVSATIQREVQKYQQVAPLLRFVTGEVFSAEHWVDVFRMLGLDKTLTLETLTFGLFLDASDNIIEHETELRELFSRAQGEISIREALQELDMWGAGAVFSLTEYKDCKSRTVWLIKDWKELITKVGDNQSLLQSLKDSPFYGNFADKASLWETRLADLDEYLSVLKTVQRKWVYLEPIFGRGALPKEQGRFSRVDDDFRGIMTDVKRDDRVLSLVAQSGLRSTLNQLADQLARCQKALNEFLEEKRLAFPRFYFIGDDDLLEILGQATNPLVIQTHLKKLFAGIHRVGFGEGNKTVTEMKSQLGEIVPLSKPVPISTNVESWLQLLAEEMKATLRALLSDCVNDADTNPSKYPSQVLCISEQVVFTQRCAKAIEAGALGQLKKELQGQLDAYTSTKIGGGDEDSAVLDSKLKALVLDVIHSIEVVSLLAEVGASSVQDWEWQKQLRYSLTRDRAAEIRMCDAKFEYTYEYQGNAPKLVHTPLTDKCYMVLTQAMHMGFGGNPFGPAGTGKTESVKALGNAFGRQVLVFNCDEGIDVNSMGRIFIGLVKCGAWGCFDEFNRLEEAVLSAVSMQIQVIQAAVKSRQATAELLERQVTIDPNSAIFITMNPAGKGYGGRQKLPDNLKQLFRPVAMSKPDLELIAEVILYSEGFKEAKNLGRKLVELYSLSRELLSKQQHYDWGLRALKTILKAGGTLLHESENAMPEAHILVQAVRVNTLSKLTFVDSARFDELVKDLFPSVQLAEIEYKELSEIIRQVYADLNLVCMPTQMKKILELYEQLRQRMGVVVVGPSGSGKTTAWRVLREALSRRHSTIKHYVMNPKCMPRSQLLGRIDMDTREWFDGVLTSAARQVVKEPLDVHSWIVCDGDIDPEWIESLNSVLDDNRLLTMPSGERIQFGPNVNFLFETHDLSSASPATISRMGMIFLSEEDVDMKLLVSSWLNTVPEERRLSLGGWLDDYFYRALAWMGQQSDFSLRQSRVGLAHNGLSHLRDVASLQDFLVGLARGMGGSLNKATRCNFYKDLFSWARESLPDGRNPLNVQVQDGRFASYSSDPDATLTLDDLYTDGVVRTNDVQMITDVIGPWLAHGDPFVVVGPEGSGKANILRDCISQLRSTTVAMLHCNAQTSAEDVLQKLSQVCMTINTNTGRVFRPKDSERLVLFLKDINLPKPDKWGTSALIAFLQQLVSYHGFYDSKSLEWIGLDGVQLVASMNPPTTLGRQDLSSRFTSVVRVLAVDYTSTEQLEEIYSAMLAPVLTEKASSDSQWRSPQNRRRLARVMVSIFSQLREKFSSDQHNHYVFTPRHLTTWCRGLLRYDFTSVPVLGAVAHEAERLFRDLLVGEDEELFDALFRSTLRSDLGFEHAKAGESFFTTFSSAGTLTDDATGRSLARLDAADFRQLVEGGLLRFSRDMRQLELSDILVDELLGHVAAIDRAMSQPGGSLLLAGLAGAQRRNMVSLVAFLHDMEVVTPKITRSYTRKAFKQDIKAVMQKTGIEGEHVVLLLEDYQLLDVSFTEMINSLLSTGEVPGLFRPEELEPLLGPLKEVAIDKGWRGSLFDLFVSRVHARLHLALVLDCSRQDFGFVCESNPAFYKSTTLLWLDRWRKLSMHQVPRLLLGESTVDQLGDLDVTALICQVHESCLAHGATPKHFTTFVSVYRDIFQSKRDVLHKQQSRLRAGLDKLSDAAGLVDDLKRKAHEQGKLLAEKQKEADQALHEIQASMVKASTQKAEVETIKTQLGQEELKLAQRTKAIETELSDVQPLVDAAKKAVGTISSDALSEIRSLRAPPDVIRDILQGVLTLMGILDTSWVSMKSFLAKRGVKEDIVSFDPRKITPTVRSNVEKLLRERGGSFEDAAAKRASRAAAPLAKWVKASLQYASVLERIEPLELEHAGLKQNLDESREKVATLQHELNQLDAQVKELRARFETCTNDHARLKIEVDREAAVITAAEQLLGKLDGERVRWADQVQAFSDDMEQLPLRALLAAGFVTYLPGSTEDGRTHLMRQWQHATGCDKFDFRKFMSSESEQLKWRAEGLPTDQLSVENAIVLLNSTRAPFLVDPASRATEWLKAHWKAAEARVEVVNVQDTNFGTALELAVRFGKTLIIQELDSVEPILLPLLRKELVAQGPRKAVQVGDKLVDYNEDFRLFMATRNSLPDLPPDIAPLITEVNFTITRAGLAGQLLGATIQHEKPEIEQRTTQLLQQEESLKVQLNDLEESLLAELTAAQGNILENKALLDSLNDTKAKSNVISESLAESMQLQLSLDEERNAYLPLAKQASMIFFAISDLNKINHVYQFSLTSFLHLFEKALATPAEPTSTDLRIKLLQNLLVSLVYAHVSQSLFKADRLMFALHLAHSTQPGEFEDQEWEFFTGQLRMGLAGGSGGDQRRAAGAPAWVHPDRVDDFAALTTNFPALAQALQVRDTDTWSEWIRTAQCEKAFPGDVQRKITPFQQVLVVQALRPDRLQSAMAAFGCQLLRLKDLTVSSVNLKRLYETDTTNTNPTLIIVSPGADPSVELAELAEAVLGRGRFHEVAMGQGQADRAMQLLRDSARQGEWLCLKNLHLVTPWLPQLEKEAKSLEAHKDFRLWLTSEAHSKFPSILLQSSLKVTYESPPGIRQNLLRTFDSWTPEMMSGGSSAQAQALFTLAWFHAVVQERRVYIPQGWSKFYEFSASDLRTAAEIIVRVSKEAAENRGIIKWKDVHGLLLDSVYGGRVADPFDNRVLKSYLRTYFNSDLIGSAKQTGRQSRLAPGVVLPTSTHFQDYVDVIKAVPERDLPEFFGLPPNIDRSQQRAISASVIEQLKTLKMSSSLALKFNRAAWSQALAPILNNWKKLYQGASVPSQPPVAKPNLEPVAAFVGLEYANAVALVHHVHRDLDDLRRVVSAAVPLTPATQSLARSLLARETPNAWLKLWDGPEDPMKWCRSVIAKTIALSSWANNATRGGLLDRPLDLGELFRPAVFLNALRQQTARVSNCSLDSLVFECSWRSTGVTGALVQVTLDNLFLEGCTFDGARLSETLRDSSSIAAAPPCVVAWIEKTASTAARKNQLSLPLYETLQREKTVTELNVPCSSEQDRWIQSGASFFLKGQ